MCGRLPHCRSGVRSLLAIPSWQGPAWPLQQRRTCRGSGSRPGPSRGAQPVQALLKGLGSVFASDPAEKTRKKYADRVQQINQLEPQMQRLTNEQLRAKTAEFQRRAQGGESLDALLVEAFAVSDLGVTAGRLGSRQGSRGCPACATQLRSRIDAAPQQTRDQSSRRLFPVGRMGWGGFRATTVAAGQL